MKLWMIRVNYMKNARKYGVKESDILHVVKHITWLRETKMKFHRVLMSVIK
jgi:hypothetical protein